MKVPILLPKIFNHPFTYETNLKLRLGDYVEVPFGKTKTVGVVWDEFEKNTEKKFQTKKVIKKLKIPNLNKKMVNFINWFAEYNVIPKGMALKLSLLNNSNLEEFPKNENLAAQRFLYSYNNLFNLYFLQGDFKEGLVIISEVIQGIEEFKNQVDPHHVMMFYYKLF